MTDLEFQPLLASSPQEQRRSYRIALLISAILLVAMHLGLLATYSNFIEDRTLVDPDSYMWLNRVTYLHDNGFWFEHNYSRINPPDGHTQHWTRPLDAILWAGALALSPFMGFEDGLYTTGLLIGPTLHLLILLILAWAVRPILPREGIPLLLFVFVLQTPVFFYASAGHPDHHTLLSLCFVGILGCLLRVVLNSQGNLRAAMGLGALLGLGLWISLEMMIVLVLVLMTLGLCWLTGHLRLALANAVQAIAFCAAVFWALFIEWGVAFSGAYDMDAIAIPHLILAALMVVFWIVLLVATTGGAVRSFKERLVLSGVSAAILLIVLYFAAPQLFLDPLGEVDPLYAATRLSKIVEFQPLILPQESWLAGLSRVMLYVGPAFIALPFTCWFATRQSETVHRVIWIMFAIMMALYLVIALQQRRWADYLAITLLIPYGMFAYKALNFVTYHCRYNWLSIVRPLTMLALVAPHLIAMVILGSLEPQTDNEDDTENNEVVTMAQRCDASAVGRLAKKHPELSKPGLALVDTDLGPEILYKTPYSVLSIPNHRPQPGYTFTHKVLGSTDFDDARRQLKRRGVEYILICTKIFNKSFTVNAGDKEVFVQNILRTREIEGYTLFDEPENTGDILLFYADE